MKLEHVQDIAKLPWQGNHAADQQLFDACDTFIRTLNGREHQRQALYLMGKHGMGINEPVTDEALDAYLN